ncbi:MAG TPA: TetR/AcrR family transcriptional regulator [Solirubrobacteraceae bacterium]|nr:TetR/AcrR family transcriptional regulator [Solirubrobacteraceae bacterium]
MVDGRSLRYAGRREELLDRAAEWVLANGLAALSLRAVASDLGISHRTLLHHFPTREQLVGEVLRELRRRSVVVLMARAQAEERTDTRSLILSMWDHFAAPENLPYHRLFFEVYGLSLSERDDYLAYYEGFESDWGDAIRELLVRAGVREREVPQIATLIVGTYRGLLLDLLVTGDGERTRAAIGELADHVASLAASR